MFLVVLVCMVILLVVVCLLRRLVKKSSAESAKESPSSGSHALAIEAATKIDREVVLKEGELVCEESGVVRQDQVWLQRIYFVRGVYVLAEFLLPLTDWRNQEISASVMEDLSKYLRFTTSSRAQMNRRFIAKIAKHECARVAAGV